MWYIAKLKVKELTVADKSGTELNTDQCLKNEIQKDNRCDTSNTRYKTVCRLIVSIFLGRLQLVILQTLFLD